MKRIVEGRDSFNPNPNHSQKPQIFPQIRIPKLGICPSTRKEVAGSSGREIHGHRRESIKEKEKLLFYF
jgi:hypothetical protein